MTRPSGYDAVIVGARCGGAATAIHLAKAGLKVLMLDRDTFPSDTLSTHWIQPSGVASLHRLGVLDEVLATGTPPVRRLHAFICGANIIGAGTFQPPFDYGLCPRRIVLDDILLRHAADAGAEVAQGFNVSELIWSDGRVAGVRGRHGKSRSTDLRARVVIGADGRNSLVAKAVAAPEYGRFPTPSAVYYTYHSGVQEEGDPTAYLVAQDDVWALLLPCDAGLYVSALGIRLQTLAEFRKGHTTNYEASLSSVPVVGPRLQGSQRASQVFGCRDLDGYFRRPYGPGWALVGDSAYHKHPVTAQGIADALRGAQLLSDSLLACEIDGPDFEAAMSKYEATRNAECLEMYMFTNSIAGAPLCQGMPGATAPDFAAIAASPQLSRRFASILDKRESIFGFFADAAAAAAKEATLTPPPPQPWDTLSPNIDMRG